MSNSFASLSPLRIGTRASNLAMAQAEEARQAIVHAWPTLYGTAIDSEFLDTLLPLVQIITSGDRIHDKRLHELGGKGLFARELEVALLEGRIDAAIHSAKDLPAEMPEGLVGNIVLPRADPADLLISPLLPKREEGYVPQSLLEALAPLPEGCIFATASVRRQAMVLAARPDMHIKTLRGNIDTRLRKVLSGEAPVTMLAMAGLERLQGRFGCYVNTPFPEEFKGLINQGIRLPHSFMTPAAGQGTLVFQTRMDDQQTRTRLLALQCPETALCFGAERAALTALDGSCQTPIGAYARLEWDGQNTQRILKLDVTVASLNGRSVKKETGEIEVPNAINYEALESHLPAAIALGTSLGDKLHSLLQDGQLRSA